MSNNGKNGLGYAKPVARGGQGEKAEPSKSDLRTLQRAATGAVASALYLGMPAPADATVVTNADLGLGGFSVQAGGSDFSWDVDGDGSAEILVNSPSSPFGRMGLEMLVNNSSGSYGFSFAVGAAFNQGGNNVAKLAIGDLVGNLSTSYAWNLGTGGLFDNGEMAPNFRDYGSNPYGTAAPTARGFLGFGFGSSSAYAYYGNLSPSETHYGWAEVEFDSVSGQFSVLRWAYEDVTGTAIAVPEPSSTAMLALGLLALGAPAQRHWRRKKDAEAQA